MLSDQVTESLEISVAGRPEIVVIHKYTTSGGAEFYGRPETDDFSIFVDVADRNEYEIKEQFKSGDTIIDIGAHIGSFSYMVLSRGAGRVYAYEAHPINHAIARKNLSQFGDRVSCFNKAVWRSDRSTETLYNDDITGFANTGGIAVVYNDSGLPVETISLDEIIFTASNNLKERIRLLKIDCEGAEYPILFTSKYLEMVEEICGEYHRIPLDVVPERAKMKNGSLFYDGNSIKRFLEDQNWTVTLKAKSETLGLFFASRKKEEAAEKRPESHGLDVDEIKQRIRESAARRKSRGNSFLIGATAELQRLLSTYQNPSASLPQRSFPSLNLAEAEFVPRADDLYHVNDLLKYHDHDFVRNAYLAILKREPDEEGLKHHLELLHDGRLNKVDILAGLLYSTEGRGKGVKVKGLRSQAAVRRLYRLPFLGYFIELAVALLRLPRTLRHQRQFEAYAIAQQRMLIDQIRQISSHGFEMKEFVRRELDKGYEIQKRVAVLQHQQIASLVRKQREIIDLQTKIEKALYTRLAQELIAQRPESQIPLTEARMEEFAQHLEHLREELLQNEKRITLLIEEARLRLPDFYQQQEMQIFSDRQNRRHDELLTSIEEITCGTREEVKDSLRICLPMLEKMERTAEILDINCGRGEWLELLRTEGLRGRGVEANAAMVTLCQDRHLNAIAGDGLVYLRSLPDASLDVVTQFRETSNSPDYLLSLFDEISRVLRPGGLLIFRSRLPSFYNLNNQSNSPSQANLIVRFLIESSGLVLETRPSGSSHLFNRDDKEILKIDESQARDQTTIARKPLI